MNGCSRAHGARLNCSKQIAASETVITEVPSGLAKRDDFGVGGRVVVGEVAIPSAADDAAVADYDRPYGNFAGFEGALGAAQSLLHPEFVGRRVCRGERLPVGSGVRFQDFILR